MGELGGEEGKEDEGQGKETGKREEREKVGWEEKDGEKEEEMQETIPREQGR